MAGFSWGETPIPSGIDSTEGDPTDGLDSSVPPQDQKWLSEDPRELTRLAREYAEVDPTAVNEAVEEYMEEPTPTEESSDEQPEVSEVEYRLEKAQCYKLLLNHRLLDGDTIEAEEVEREIQDFVRQRLAELMGVKGTVAKDRFPVNIGETVAIAVEKALASKKAEFSDAEVDALRAVAARILKKPEIITTKEPPKAPANVKPAAQAAPELPQAVKPAPVQPTLLEKRKPGRPRKTPAPVAPTRARVPGPPNAANETVRRRTKVEPPKETVNEVLLETLPDGTRIVQRGDRKYKIIRKMIMQKNGTAKEDDFAMDITPAVKGPNTLPFPRQEVTNQTAAQEAQYLLQKQGTVIQGAAVLWGSTPHEEREPMLTKK